MRRTVIDKPERDRVVDFLSMNEDYVIEDYGACALIEGIALTDSAAAADATATTKSETAAG